MKKLLFLSFCLIWLPLFSSAQIIQGESTTTQTLFVPEKKIPEKGYPRYQGDIYLYNPQNEMFQRFKTKCSFLQNEAYLCKSFFLP